MYKEPSPKWKKSDNLFECRYTGKYNMTIPKSKYFKNIKPKFQNPLGNFKPKFAYNVYVTISIPKAG